MYQQLFDFESTTVTNVWLTYANVPKNQRVVCQVNSFRAQIERAVTSRRILEQPFTVINTQKKGTVDTSLIYRKYLPHGRFYASYRFKYWHNPNLGIFTELFKPQMFFAVCPNFNTVCSLNCFCLPGQWPKLQETITFYKQKKTFLPNKSARGLALCMKRFESVAYSFCRPIVLHPLSEGCFNPLSIFVTWFICPRCHVKMFTFLIVFVECSLSILDYLCPGKFLRSSGHLRGSLCDVRFLGEVVFANELSCGTPTSTPSRCICCHKTPLSSLIAKHPARGSIKRPHITHPTPFYLISQKIKNKIYPICYCYLRGAFSVKTHKINQRRPRLKVVFRQVSSTGVIDLGGLISVQNHSRFCGDPVRPFGRVFYDRCSRSVTILWGA